MAQEFGASFSLLREVEQVNQNRIDRFVRKASVPEDVTVPIMLTAGKPVDIVLEYFENGGDASAVLSWSSPSEPKAVIPTSALAPQ